MVKKDTSILYIEIINMNLFSNYNEETAKKFLNIESGINLSYLIYRDLPTILKKYLTNGTALDFGCGPGISSRFLSKLGFEVIGVDINKEMIKEAFIAPDGIPFALIEHGKLPFKNNKFDLVIAIMVLLEMPSILAIQEAVNEITRVLKPGGIFLTVVGSEYFPTENWINKNPVGNNINLVSGDVFFTYSQLTGITFKDYFYTDNDYSMIFKHSNLNIIEKHKALGKIDDKIPWKIEFKINPFIHYVCQKII